MNKMNLSLSKREISALKTAVLNIHKKDTLDEVKDICAEQIYRDYFCLGLFTRKKVIFILYARLYRVNRGTKYTSFKQQS